MLLILIQNRLLAILNGVRKSRKNRGRLLGLAFLLALPIVIFFQVQLMFQALMQVSGAGLDFIRQIVNLALSGLFVFLLFSGLAVVLHFIFLSKDLPLLLALPLKLSTIYNYKFIEATLANSAIFFFFGVPLIIGFGAAAHVSWLYYPAGLILIAFFLSIPTGLATALSLALIKVIPAHRAKSLSTILTTLLFIILWAGFQFLRISRIDPTSASFDPNSIGTFKTVARQVIGYFPSDWLTGALFALIKNDWSRAALYTLLLFLCSAAFIILNGRLLNAAYEKDFLGVKFSPGTYRRNNKTTKPGKYRSGFSAGALLIDIIRRDVKLILRDPRHFSQLLLYVAIMIVFPFISEGNNETMQGFWGDYYPYFFLIVFSGLMASMFSARLVPIEKFAFSCTKSSPRPMWIFILAKLILGVVLAIAAAIITLGIYNFKFHASLLVTLRVFAVLLMMCFAAAGIGIFFGAAFAKFDWEHPKRMLRGNGNLMLTITTMSYLFINFFILNFLIKLVSFSVAMLVPLLFTIITVILGTVLAYVKLDKTEWIY